MRGASSELTGTDVLILIASGIIRQKEEEVRDALVKAGFTVEEVRHKGEWVAMAARKA